MILSGEDTAETYSVYSVAVTTGTATLLGSGTVGTLLGITDFLSCASDNLLVFRVAASATTQTIYGGKLFTDDLGSQINAEDLSPSDFLMNNDG